MIILIYISGRTSGLVKPLDVDILDHGLLELRFVFTPIPLLQLSILTLSFRIG